MEKSKLKTLVTLFFTSLKIGLFSFGGGYAMIALTENEFAEKRKWIKKEEFADIVAIAESTPGPIAINSSTFVGYTIGGVWGAILATIAVCIPAFTIIFLISLFFDRFLAFKYVALAFKGIRVGVTFLIVSAGFKMLLEVEKSPFNIVIFAITVACVILFSLFGVDFSSIFYILISALAGIIAYSVKAAAAKRKGAKTSETTDPLPEKTPARKEDKQ